MLTIAIAVAAIAVAAMALRREFDRPRGSVNRRVSEPPSYEKEWKALTREGILVGNAQAPVQIVEFGDFECPACKRFHESFLSVQRTRVNRVALVFIHFPLPMHRFARAAAQAAECAATQGRFAEFQNAVFAGQASFGQRSWTSYARDAEIRDTLAFARCASDSATAQRVEHGFSLGMSIGARSTPTVLINGWRFGSLSAESLSSIVDRVAAGKPPLASMRLKD